MRVFNGTKDYTKKNTFPLTLGYSPSPETSTINSFMCANFQNFLVFMKLFTFAHRVPLLN